MVINVRRLNRRSNRRRWPLLRQHVLFNGRELRDVFYVDRRRGVIRQYVRDERGRLLVDRLMRARTIERRGRVQLVRMKAHE